MNTTERKNQIKILKKLIAEAVKKHKATKKTARMSSKSEEFDAWKRTCAQCDCIEETKNLFVAYTVYHMLRHGIDGEDNVKSYIDSVVEKLRPEKRNGYFSCGQGVIPLKEYHGGCATTLHKAAEYFIQNLNDYVEGNR